MPRRRTTLAALVSAAAVAAGAALPAAAPPAAAAAAPAPNVAATRAPVGTALGPAALPQRPVGGIVVRMRAHAPVDRRVAAAVAAAAGVQGARQVRRTVGGASVVALSEPVTEQQAAAAAARIGARADVEWAQPDRWVYPASTPVPAYDDHPQWNLWDAAASSPVGGYGVRPASAWEGSRGSAGVVVAVIDTGITAHPDLEGRVLPGYDFVSLDDLPPGNGLNLQPLTANDGDGRDADPSDPGDWITATESTSYNFFYGCPQRSSSWHGTHVAGIIAAVPGNGQGVVGVAPDVRILPVRAVGKCAGSESDIADAIAWAAGASVTGVPDNPTPASVVNLSLSGSGACKPLLQDAIDTARAHGATVVAAAGNSGGSVLPTTGSPGSFPADCQGVVSVAAIDRTGGLGRDSRGAVYSNTGTAAGDVTLAAPGGSQDGNADDGIWSTVNAGATRPSTPSYASYVGTSMAAPHVSAAAALLQSLHVGGTPLTPDEVKAALVQLVQPFPDGTCASSAVKPCGAGILDLAMLAPQQVLAQPGDGTVTVSWRAPADVGGVTASAYRVERSTGGGPWESLTSTVAPGDSFADGGVVNGTGYRYRATALFGGGAGPPSDASETVTPSTTVVPGPPATLQAQGGVDSLAVAWTAPPEPVTGYALELRDSATSPWTCAQALVGGQCTALPGGSATLSADVGPDADLLPAGQYDVRVTAIGTAARGLPSRPVRVSVTGLQRSAALSATTVRPAADGYQDTVTVTATSNLASPAEIRVLPDGGGPAVRTYSLPAATSFSQAWDGTDDADQAVPEGTYTVQVLTDDVTGTPTPIATAQPLTVRLAPSHAGAPAVSLSTQTVYWPYDKYLDSTTITVRTDVPTTQYWRITNKTGTRTYWTRSFGTRSTTATRNWQVPAATAPVSPTAPTGSGSPSAPPTGPRRWPPVPPRTRNASRSSSGRSACMRTGSR